MHATVKMAPVIGADLLIAVTERQMLKLERQAMLSLARRPATAQRMLAKGTPVQN